MEIHWLNTDAFLPADMRKAEQRIGSLAEAATDVIDVRIGARPSGHHRHGGQEVRITCEARGREIVAARTRPDIGQALNEALDAFERELRKLRDRRAERRPGSEHPAPPERGVVDEVLADEDHGFILTDSGERVYFHRNALHGGLAFEALEEGQRVALQIEGGEKGPQASVVRPAPTGS